MVSADNLTSPATGEGTSQTERVIARLREMILRGEFRPGERLAELTLVPLLNASRTPVRLALERLAHHGLLEAQPNGGFRVREFTIAEIWDAIEVRGILEGTAARFAAERLSGPDEVEELRKSCREMDNMVPDDWDTFLRYTDLNASFHREVWRLSKSPMLLRALESVSALPFAEPGALVFEGAKGHQASDIRRLTLALEQHRAIAEAIGDREGARAESLAREHSRMARANLTRALEDSQLRTQVPGASLIVEPKEAESAGGKKTGRHR